GTGPHQEAVSRSDAGNPRTAAEGRRGTPANRPARAGPAVRIAAAHVGSPAAGPRTGRPVGVPAAGPAAARSAAAGPVPAAGSGFVGAAGTGTEAGADRTAGRDQVAGLAAGRDGRPHRSCRPQASALEWAVRSRGDRPATSALTETQTAPRAASRTGTRAAHQGVI